MIEEYLKTIRSEVYKRSRFNELDTLIDIPNDDEIDAAIYDSLDDINSTEPASDFTIESIMSNSDTRWKRLLYLGASKGVVQTLLFDWTAHGIDVDLGDGVAVSSKLPDYQSLFQLLDEQFDKLLDKLKASSSKLSRVSHFNTKKNNSTGAFASRASKYHASYRS